MGEGGQPRYLGKGLRARIHRKINMLGEGWLNENCAPWASPRRSARPVRPDRAPLSGASPASPRRADGDAVRLAADAPRRSARARERTRARPTAGAAAG